MLFVEERMILLHPFPKRTGFVHLLLIEKGNRKKSLGNKKEIERIYKLFSE